MNQIKSHSKNIMSNLLKMQEIGVLAITVLFIIIINMINPAFSSFSNITNVLRSTGFYLIIAVGVTFVFIGGGLDISVGSTLAVGSTIASLCLKAGMSIPLAMLLAILTGTAIGYFNGIVIQKMKISALIVTLGTMYAGRGIVYILTKGIAVYPLPAEFLKLEQQAIFGIPKVIIIAFILVAIAHVVLTKTTFGRSVYAIGGNMEAARLSGISSTRIGIATYAMTGALAALSGIMMASRLGSGQAGIGQGLEMNIIAAVIIGGTSINGGAGTALGTAVGALFMNILENSMTLMKISVYWQNLIIGLILIIAAILDQVRNNQAMKSKSNDNKKSEKSSKTVNSAAS